jgi:hypothetical protein
MAERYKTGEDAPKEGTYAFDGYLDGTWNPAPTANESTISLSEGEKFPPIKSQNKGCWWKFVS